MKRIKWIFALKFFEVYGEPSNLIKYCITSGKIKSNTYVIEHLAISPDLWIVSKSSASVVPHYNIFMPKQQCMEP